jgi:hypothetical protein
MSKINIQELGIKYVLENLSDKTRIDFRDIAVSFYDDTCGQREHKVEQYIAYGTRIKNHLRITRKLSFTNKVDEGKEGAILAIINMDQLAVLCIGKNEVIFDMLTISWK